MKICGTCQFYKMLLTHPMNKFFMFSLSYEYIIVITIKEMYFLSSFIFIFHYYTYTRIMLCYVPHDLNIFTAFIHFYLVTLFVLPMKPGINVLPQDIFALIPTISPLTYDNTLPIFLLILYLFFHSFVPSRDHFR